MYVCSTNGVIYRKKLDEWQCFRSRIAGENRLYKMPLMEQKEKNKGGRPPGSKEKYYNRKLTLYLSDEEYDRVADFLEYGWLGQNYSSGARFLLLHSLEQWEKRGGKQVTLRGKF